MFSISNPDWFVVNLGWWCLFGDLVWFLKHSLTIWPWLAQNHYSGQNGLDFTTILQSLCLRNARIRHMHQTIRLILQNRLQCSDKLLLQLGQRQLSQEESPTYISVFHSCARMGLVFTSSSLGLLYIPSIRTISIY